MQRKINSHNQTFVPSERKVIRQTDRQTDRHKIFSSLDKGNEISYSRVKDKLRRLGSPNRIVDHSKLDSNKFGRQSYEDLDFKVKIVWYHIVSVSFDQIGSISV